MGNLTIKKPQFILSKEIVLKQVDFLEKHFDCVSFSWKTNPFVGQVIQEKKEDTMFSIISINELKQFIETLKGKSQQEKEDMIKRVLFFPFGLTEKDLEFLMEENIRNFVIENTFDLKQLLSFVQKNKYKVNIQLRMKLRENTIFTGKHYVFGMKLHQIKEWVPKLHDNALIGKVGIHFHRKTQNVSEWNLRNEVEKSLEDILHFVDELNLGGGLPANYKNIHDKSIESIFVKIKELKEYTDAFGIKLFIEPGRFIAAPAVQLKASIMQIVENTCFLNCSIFNGTLDTVIANVKLHVQGELEKGSIRYLLKGCTPDSCDILRYSVYLDNPKIGDEIVFLNCGAYTYQTNFCALDFIETKIVDKF